MLVHTADIILISYYIILQLHKTRYLSSSIKEHNVQDRWCKESWNLGFAMVNNLNVWCHSEVWDGWQIDVSSLNKSLWRHWYWPKLCAVYADSLTVQLLFLLRPVLLFAVKTDKTLIPDRKNTFGSAGGTQDREHTDLYRSTHGQCSTIVCCIR